MKKYLVIIPVLFLIYFFTIEEKNSASLFEVDKKDQSENTNELVSVFYNDQNLNLSIDEYVVGVLSCEMPASFNIEALKAGAIAARTFYMYKKNYNSMYIASNTDQCFIDENGMKNKWGENYEKYYSIIKSAVNDTANLYITFNDEIIESFYFSMSNGLTENSENVFNEKLPYLVSVPSSWDKNVTNYEKQISFSKEDFLNKLGINFSSDVKVEILSKTDSGRVNLIKINDKEFKGTDFRKLLSIRSTDFDIQVDDEIIITTRGYGHGVGLSQYGANEMAKLGYNYEEILKYYYKGVEISSL